MYLLSEDSFSNRYIQEQICSVISTILITWYLPSIYLFWWYGFLFTKLSRCIVITGDFSKRQIYFPRETARPLHIGKSIAPVFVRANTHTHTKVPPKTRSIFTFCDHSEARVRTEFAYKWNHPRYRTTITSEALFDKEAKSTHEYKCSLASGQPACAGYPCLLDEITRADRRADLIEVHNYTVR